MAERSILFTWGAPTVGRENMGLEVFQAALAYYDRLKQEKVIAEYRVGVTSQGNVGELAGFLLVEGDPAKLSAMTETRDYRMLVAKATHVVANFRIVECATGPDMMRRIEEVVTARRELGI